MYITATQARAARAILGHSQEQVAKGSDCATKTVTQFEAESVKPNIQTIESIFHYYDKHDIQLLNDGIGVTRKTKDIITLNGRSGFRALFDDIYDVARDTGGDIAILFGSPQMFLNHLGENWYMKHAARMSEIKSNINFRIVAEKGKEIAHDFAEYRWVSEQRFHNSSVYLYGTKVAFITFSYDDVTIEVVNRPSMHETFSDLFNITWKSLEDDV